ncbi:hypothetical protein NE236_08350 [Actinoallomurus purpureus]|uniref:hypothetical protein n=1 Tax=Actinoallomurus purpureus TaxID=478114 RepID=UPI0020938B96|nr:hypothetical protein [Actinoallomurus purpureus]MCO6004990.1 hypothetical protein [Actinoallomurus purpureus]
MRGGIRLPALIVALGLLAGCSDPAGAARREQAATRKKSPSPHATASHKPAKRHAKAAPWWQAVGTTRTAGGLRLKTGALKAGRVKVIVTDVTGHAERRFTASATPQSVAVGGFTLTAVKVSRSTKTGRYGVGFRYRH